MPANIQMSAGPLTSAPYEWASQTNTTLVQVLRDFATDEDGLKLPAEATNQQVLDAINQLAGRRIHNYIRNWYRNKQKALSDTAIEQENPLVT